MDLKPATAWAWIIVATIAIVFTIAVTTNNPILDDLKVWLVEHTPNK